MKSNSWKIVSNIFFFLSIFLCSFFILPSNYASADITLTLTTDSSSYYYHENVILTANLSSLDNTTLTPADITFYYGPSPGTKIYSMKCNTAAFGADQYQYQYTWTQPATGNYSLYAKIKFSDNSVLPSTVVNITVNPYLTPTVSLTTDNTTYTYPQNVILTATAWATGTVARVAFYDGSTLLGTVTSSPYTFTLTNASAGTHTLKAVVTDNIGTSTTSTPVSIIVNHIPPVASLSTDQSSYIYPQGVVMTAGITLSAGSVTAVSFYKGSTLLKTITSSPYTYTWTPSTAPPAGSSSSYSFTVKVTDSAGSSTTSSPADITVTAHISPTVSLSTDQTSYIYPQGVVMTANAWAAGPIKSVSFYNGSTLLKTLTSSPYTYTWTPTTAPPAGGSSSYNLTAKVTDSLNASTTSSIVSITVTPHVSPTVSLSTDESSYIYPQGVVLTANAWAAGPIKSVSFYNGSTLLKTVTSSPYKYTWIPATAPPAGGSSSYNLTAKVTDSLNASTTSSIVSITVLPHKPPVVSFSVNNTACVLPVVPVLTANVSVSMGTISSVAFYNGKILLAKLTVPPYTYTWSGVPTPSLGAIKSYNLTAVATDSTNASTTSSSVTVTVARPPPPTINIAIPCNNTIFNTSSSMPANIIIYPNIIHNASIASVAFYRGTTLIGTATSAPFSYTWNNVPVGTYSLTAKATDIYGTLSALSPAVSVTVTSAAPVHLPPTVNISAPVNNASYLAPASIPLSASAYANNSTITGVTFFNTGINGTTLIGNATGSNPFTYNWSNVAAGNYSITAVVTDATGASTTSSVVYVSVVSPSSTPLVPVVNNLVGLTNAASIYDAPGGNVIGSLDATKVGTVLAGPQTSSDQYFQVHFPNTNITGWVDQNNLKVLATTSTEEAVYALIEYASPSYNLTPAIGGLTNAQATLLNTAISNLSGQKFMIFNGQVILMESNTNIAINNVGHNATMVVSTVGTLAQNYGTVLLADLSQVDALSTCSTGDPWHSYVYCLLDNEAKTVMSNCLASNNSSPTSCDTALNLNTDAVMTAVTSYLNATYASIGGIAQNFVMTIDPDGQGVEIDPAKSNSLSASDGSVSVTFYNDPLVYDPNSVVTGFSQIESQTTDTDTTSFYIVSDNMIDEKNVSDINELIESVGSNSSAKSAQLQKAEVQKAALRMAAIQELSIRKSVQQSLDQEAIKSVLSTNSKAESTTAQSVSLPDDQTCYGQQSGAVIPCNTIIDYVQGQRDGWLNLPAGGTSTMATLMFQDVAELQSLGYTVNRITYADPQFVNDSLGINFLKSLIQTQGQVLFLQFHGSGNSVEDASVGAGKIFPFGCINPYLSQYQSQADPVLAAVDDLENQLKAQLYPGYINQDPTIPGVIGFKQGFGCYAYVNGIKKPTLGWGIDLNSTNIRSKALETGYPCHGQLGMLKPLAGVRQYGAMSVYLNPPPSKSASQARFDLKLLIKYLEGIGPLTPASITPILFDQGSPYNSYPPQLNSQFNSYLINTLDNGGPNASTGEGTKNLFDCTNTVSGPSGNVVVNIPCKMQPIGSLHLFPYVNALAQSSNGMTLTFSDRVTSPLITFPINGKNAILNYSYADNNQYSIDLMPEVELLDQGTYNSYVSSGLANQIPIAMFSVSGATSSVNGIPMIGNSLAALTQKGSSTKPYFLYDQYFWNYDGRNPLGGDNVNVFNANIPYRLHPYVDSVTSSGNQLTINFSKPVQGAGDATSYVTVSVPQTCTTAGAFDNNGTPPEFSSSNGISMSFNPNLVIPSSNPTGNITITVHDIVSSPDNFPLLSPSNLSSTPFSYTGGTQSTNYKNQFLQTPGSFTMSVPCSCTKACQNKNDGDPDGCGGTCDCVCNGGSTDNCGNACTYTHTCTPSGFDNSIPMVPGNYPEANCGGAYNFDGCVVKYVPPSNCSYADSSCNNSVDSCGTNVCTEENEGVVYWCFSPASGTSNCPSALLNCS